MNKKIIKESLSKYAKARKEKSNCKEPCIKNGRSDRFCYKCADEIIGPVIDDIKNS